MLKPINTAVSAFVEEWITRSNAKSILHLKVATWKIFSNARHLATQEVSAIRSIPNERYDLILGDLPLWLSPVERIFGTQKIKAPENWFEILEALAFLAQNGTALFVLEPLGFSTAQGITFEKELNKRGFFVNAFINCPEKILLPETYITPVLVLLSKKETPQIFISELLNEAQAKEMVCSYFSNSAGNNLAKGKYIALGDFYGFSRLKSKEQIECLKTEYKTYKEYQLADLTVKIHQAKTGEQFQEINNTIYIPKIGDSRVVCKLEDIKLKHHSYFQIILSDEAINGYVALFFNSTLGRFVLDSLKSGSVLLTVSKASIETALVALPNLSEQKLIAETQQKLQRLQSTINHFDSELALNPVSSSAIPDQLDKMLAAIDALTDADKIRRLAREGESKSVEFKQTFSLDIKEQKKAEYLETSALKTLIAFLNTDGGTLLIGVADNGQILGIEAEIEKLHKNVDKFLLHWKGQIKSRIGEGLYPLIEYRAAKVDTKTVLLVECKASPGPCYLNKNEFYVRTNPSTDKLEGPALVGYVQNHFKPAQ